MGWRIGCLKNTLTFPPECDSALIAWADANGHEQIVYRGELQWGDLEHACWFMYEEEVIDIFVKHGTRGEVLWGSVDGDNAGSFWGWRFEEGRCVKLKGTLTWAENHSKESSHG